MDNHSGQDTHADADTGGYRKGTTGNDLEPLYRLGVWRLLAVAMLLAIGVLSLIPSPPRPPGVLGWDKAQHFAAYLVLAWWWVQCWRRRLPWVVAGLAGYGLLLEGLQALSPVRMLELGDMLANAAGTVAGGLLARTAAGRVLLWLDRLTAGGRPR
jgi:VanZ family protein